MALLIEAEPLAMMQDVAARLAGEIAFVAGR